MFFGNPEEAQAMMMQAQMQAGLKLHLFNEIVDGLDEDHLQALATIFDIASKRTDIAAQFYGQMQAILRIKFKVCTCGINHDAEFQVPDDASALGGPTSPNVVPVDASEAVHLINKKNWIEFLPNEEEPPTEADGFPG